MIDYHKRQFHVLNEVDCPDDAFRHMVLMNSMVDSIATYAKGVVKNE
jgi:hypothetical protein